MVVKKMLSLGRPTLKKEFKFDILPFQVEPGWLEPLLIKVHENPKRLASPVIENIHLEEYHFEPVSTYLRGFYLIGHTWSYLLSLVLQVLYILTSVFAEKTLKKEDIFSKF